MTTIFAAFAELEREWFRDRQLESIAVAKAASGYARDLGMSRQTIQAVLAGSGKYVGLAST